MITTKFSFPRGFPLATTGVLLEKGKTLITGHDNGFVVNWNLSDKTHKVLLETGSTVMSIADNGEGQIAVGCFSGGLYIIDLAKGKTKTLRPPKYSKNSRVWRTEWVDNKNLLLTSTYGELTPFLEVNGEWIEDYWGLKAHVHSIFGMDSINGKYVATGDYYGNITIWKFQDNKYYSIQTINVVGTIQDINWYDENRFAAITKSGKMYLVEKEHEEKESWQTVLEVDIAKNRGVCVRITDDGKYIFAGTLGELIQFDLDSNQSEAIPIADIKGIFSMGKYTYILAGTELCLIENKPVEFKEEIISYKFVKISLLGYTGTGKTTFCSQLVQGSIDKIYSTFGKRIFNLKIGNAEEIEKRIVFHDYGGQETALDTFIPFILDSDIILIFHKKTDKNTYSKSLEILRELRKKANPNIPVYFIQTFIDHELDDIPLEAMENLVQRNEISGFVKMSPKDNLGFEDFEKTVLKKIDWNHTRKMIRSPYSEGIPIALLMLESKGYPVVLFDVFKQTYQDLVGDKISQRHLKFLLEDYTNQGVIEFYPEISDLIILDDKVFNKMRTDIPRYADEMGGIVSLKDLKDKFDNEEFLAILDEMYSQSGIAIKNGDLRIFPRRLSLSSIEIPSDYKEALSVQKENELFVKFQDIDIGRLITLLSDLRLKCIRLARNEGLFAWEDNAFIYYFIHEARKGIFEKYIAFNYCVGGKKDKTQDRLQTEFLAAVERAYGAIIDVDKKKS